MRVSNVTNSWKIHGWNSEHSRKIKIVGQGNDRLSYPLRKKSEEVTYTNIVQADVKQLSIMNIRHLPLLTTNKK